MQAGDTRRYRDPSICPTQTSSVRVRESWTATDVGEDTLHLLGSAQLRVNHPGDDVTQWRSARGTVGLQLSEPRWGLQSQAASPRESAMPGEASWIAFRGMDRSRSRRPLGKLRDSATPTDRLVPASTKLSGNAHGCRSLPFALLLLVPRPPDVSAAPGMR